MNRPGRARRWGRRCLLTGKFLPFDGDHAAAVGGMIHDVGAPIGSVASIGHVQHDAAAPVAGLAQRLRACGFGQRKYVRYLHLHLA